MALHERSDDGLNRVGFEPRDTETPATKAETFHWTSPAKEACVVERTDRLTFVPNTPNARLQFRACGGASARFWASDQEVNGGNPRSPIYRAP
jgi:hypothetical protein